MITKEEKQHLKDTFTALASNPSRPFREAENNYDADPDSEFFFFLGNDSQYFYSLMIDEDDKNYYVICYDDESVDCIFENFPSLDKKAFFERLSQQQDTMRFCYEFAFGRKQSRKKPKEIDDILQNHYYNGNNYVFALEVGTLSKNEFVRDKTTLQVYYYLKFNPRTGHLFFEERYFNDQLKDEQKSFDDLINSFIHKSILKPLEKRKEDLRLNDYLLIQIINF